jgi:hypothetical protein
MRNKRVRQLPEMPQGDDEEAGDWKPETSFSEAILRFLDEMFPGMEERGRIAELCAHFEEKNVEGLVVTLRDATFMKLFGEAYFPRTAKQKAQSPGGGQSVRNVLTLTTILEQGCYCCPRRSRTFPTRLSYVPSRTLPFRRYPEFPLLRR